MAVIGPLAAYITASRKLSGRIGTSEASQLWAESSKIRDDYRDRLAGTDKRQADLEARVATLEALNVELRRENVQQSQKVMEYESIIKELRTRLDALERENAELREVVSSLEKRLANARE